MGAPESDRPRIHEWADVISAQLDNIGPMDVELRRRADEVLREYRDYLLSLFAARASDPRDDLVSALVAAEEEGSKLSEDELVATCVLLLGAGHETTVGLIGNGTLAFLRNPDQWRRLREQPDLLEGAVEECFRYDGPVRMTYRVALEEVEVEEVAIGAGEVVLVLLASANRDPARFPDPDRFDIARPGERNFGSGFGIHFCLGSVLSRVESRIAFGRMAARWGELSPRLDLDRVEMRDAMMICRPERVPVAVAPSG
jgi:pimeloyl-[acyl-carrier protein] synthase